MSEEFNKQDVLHPRKWWLGTSCYRVNRKESDMPKIDTPPQETAHKSYDDNEELHCADLTDPDVEVLENGRFKTTIRLPQAFYAYIIGTRGSRKKKLEEETKTEITVPRQATNNKIIITGPTERSVVGCKSRLQMIDIDLRNRHQKTHFISFPMVSDEIKENFNKFKELVLAEGHIDGMSESIFKKDTKLHITIGMMILLDNDEKREASELLDKCQKEIILPQLASHEPLIIKMKGLEYMNDDPSHVDVLYSKVQVDNHSNPDILQKISDDIVEFFCNEGLMKKEQDHVKLHVTVINTRYRKDDEKDDSGSRNRDRKRSRRIAFDARPILEKYSDFDFGQQKLEFIHLSERFSVDENGYYEPIHKISCT